MNRTTNRFILFTLSFALLVAGEALALTPTPTPTPRPPTPTPTPQTSLSTFKAACSLGYVFADQLYPSREARTCGILTTIQAASGMRYFYPTSCLIAAGQRSCYTTVDLAKSRNPLPPGSVIKKVTVHSEKLNRPFQMEELKGCTYADGLVQTAPVHGPDGKLIGVNVNHLLVCKDYPASQL